MPSESSYWIVSAPVQEEKSTEQMYKDLSQRLVSDSAAERSEVAPLAFPQLKTGTLESLIALSEELPKTDAFFASVVTRIVDTLRALFNDDDQALNEHLVLDGESVEDYLMHWQWNAGKYRADRALPELVETLNKEMQSIDNVMKQKLNTYNLAKGQLQQLERKKHGNLSVCSLADVVRKDDVVDADSDFLVTLLVVVPKTQKQQWLDKYERLTSMVVPRSSNELAQDDEYALYNVTVFKKVEQEFVQKAREQKFQVREFTFDEEALGRERKELDEAGASEKELWTELVRLSRTNFAEAYQAAVHFKVLRTFVESVLRFGLPANYFAAVVRPNPRRVKQLIKSLVAEFSHLSEYMSKSDQNGEEAPTTHETPGEYANLLEQEVYPFVLTEQPMITV
ncbi:Vacuolar ATP synthase subunit C [Malassezia japonica]|uniref:V-type proton ATPase subunit C n=1 Tax=Malassezia japonica TaxID=223818 RepID=A0AAF0EZU0_9BASI|nr:Vacuolar ATP synthase subunit C [Malassezia japonica]WFD40146.1 Vacuolar ATP synthase subunit C [Malassezia japonica]